VGIVMNQQINLFQPIFRKERKVLSFAALVQFSGIMLAALAALYGYGIWSNSRLTIDISGLKKQHDERIKMLERVSREAANRSGGDEVEKEVQRLEAELSAERYIVSLLGKDKLDKSLGFSEYLEIFSRRVVQGMWISKFSVFDGGKHMLIKGGALSAELLPLFLQGLSKEPSLTGMEFTVLQMARDESKQAWIEFVLSSKELESSVENH
jgi:hypothetical protein